MTVGKFTHAIVSRVPKSFQTVATTDGSCIDILTARKQHEHLADLVDRMQQRLRTFKKQIEEAEEIAALNLAKYRQVQSALGVAEERADMSEQALARVKTRARSASIGPVSITCCYIQTCRL